MSTSHSENEPKEPERAVFVKENDTPSLKSFCDKTPKDMKMGLLAMAGAINCIREVNKSTMVSNAKSDRIKDCIALGR